jgi:hypothetical protein
MSNDISEKKRQTWGVLVASKRRLREILTGETLPKVEGETIADDLVVGVPAISKETGLTKAQIYHRRDALGVKRLGRTNNAA